jgi:hypothetical protein
MCIAKVCQPEWLVDAEGYVFSTLISTFLICRTFWHTHPPRAPASCPSRIYKTDHDLSSPRSHPSIFLDLFPHNASAPLTINHEAHHPPPLNLHHLHPGPREPRSFPAYFDMDNNRQWQYKRSVLMEHPSVQAREDGSLFIRAGESCISHSSLSASSATDQGCCEEDGTEGPCVACCVVSPSKRARCCPSCTHTGQQSTVG